MVVNWESVFPTTHGPSPDIAVSLIKKTRTDSGLCVHVEDSKLVDAGTYQCSVYFAPLLEPFCNDPYHQELAELGFPVDSLPFSSTQNAVSCITCSCMDEPDGSQCSHLSAALRKIQSIMTCDLYLELRGFRLARKKRSIARSVQMLTREQYKKKRSCPVSSSFEFSEERQRIMNMMLDPEWKCALETFYGSRWLWKRKWSRMFLEEDTDFGRRALSIARKAWELKQVIPYINHGKVVWYPIVDNWSCFWNWYDDPKEDTNGCIYPPRHLAREKASEVLTPIMTATWKAYAASTVGAHDLLSTLFRLPLDNRVNKLAFCLEPWLHPLRQRIVSIPGEGFLIRRPTRFWLLCIVAKMLKASLVQRGRGFLITADALALAKFGLTAEEPFRAVVCVEIDEAPKSDRGNDVNFTRGNTITTRDRVRDALTQTRTIPSPDRAMSARIKNASYSWKVACGKKLLSLQEFQTLVSKNKWIGGLKSSKDILKKTAVLPKHLSRFELIRASLVPGEVFVGDRLKDLFVRMTDYKPATPPTALTCTLRSYQMDGYAWAMNLLRNGFGALLADEMGLGKTIQAIAVMVGLSAIHPDSAPILCCCPASLMGNWQSELARFAPQFRVARLHGTDTDVPATPNTVILTTYATLASRIDAVQTRNFLMLCLDEVQNIKNHRTKAFKAVARLRSDHRLVLTGTPVENSTIDLWSIADIILPGYLGSIAYFRKHLQDDPVALQRLLRPFMLRRTKAVVTNLLDKVITTVPLVLTPLQKRLYVQETERSLASIESSDSIQKKGRVLALLTRLKQISNHPQMVGEGGENDSTKMNYLFKTVRGLDQTDKMLIFTQYVAMARIIREQLCTFGQVCYIDGGMPPHKRTEAVERFQTDERCRFFVISLRAGGVGLNLTRANIVVMYDLWWNPAVESQAIDRAHRIGQTNQVTVLRLCCAGTIEQRIDSILERKRAISDACMQHQNTMSWLTTMTREQLAGLVSLDDS